MHKFGTSTGTWDTVFEGCHICTLCSVSTFVKPVLSKKKKHTKPSNISIFSGSSQEFCACWMLATHAQLPQECLSLCHPRWKRESCQAMWKYSGRKNNKVGAAGCYQKTGTLKGSKGSPPVTSHPLSLRRTSTDTEINPQALPSCSEEEQTREHSMYNHLLAALFLLGNMNVHWKACTQ